MTTDERERLAYLTAEVSNLKKEVGDMKDQLGKAMTGIQRIEITLAAAGGHWKAMVMFGTAMTAIGAIVAQLWSTLRGH